MNTDHQLFKIQQRPQAAPELVSQTGHRSAGQRAGEDRRRPVAASVTASADAVYPVVKRQTDVVNPAQRVSAVPKIIVEIVPDIRPTISACNASGAARGKPAAFEPKVIVEIAPEISPSITPRRSTAADAGRQKAASAAFEPKVIVEISPDIRPSAAGKARSRSAATEPKVIVEVSPDITPPFIAQRATARTTAW